MPLRYREAYNEAFWAVWEITEREEVLWKKADLSPAEASRMRQITHARRRLEALAARAARTALPPLPNFSLSHSFPWAAAACASFPIALDLERKRPFPPHVWLYFTEYHERQILSPPYVTEWHFWCAKEAAYKLLSSEFDSISFCRDMFFTGKEIHFTRAGAQRRIRLIFRETSGWLLGVAFPAEIGIL
ncbi:MAG: hypothetical protein ABDH91_04310 [Bacteroidia bacterium]